ncbi:MAG: methyl-accepting chemotaxis protein [Proteobacteria bacterium]|nr:methyl-accepting chemotaxis protein [Pseudomonadota bacterium]
MGLKIFRIMHLGNLTIKARLGVGLGLIIAFMVILTITGIWSLYGINGKLERIIKVDNAKIELAYVIQNAVSTLDKSMLTIVLANDESVAKAEKKKIDDAREVYNTSLKKLETLENTAKGKELIEEIKQNITIVYNANDKIIEQAAAGNIGQASTMLSGSLQISAMLTEACNVMVKYQQERIGIGAKDAYTTYTRARYFLLIIGAVVFVFAIFLASFLARSITKPLREGVLVAQRIAEGDLTALIEVTGTDETSQLLGAMKDMVMKLQRIISGVKTAAGNIASASHQLNSSSELMSQGAGEQAGRATQVATASEEMSQTILDIAKNTSSIETSATETANLAKNGEVVVDSSVEKIKSIAKTIDESAQLIKSLGDRSNQIGEIVTVIDDIADQTNLLALNAAIEAARAGDVGRGFAVVADEVKKLAERAGNATAKIGGMIKAIQSEVHQIVLSMENITKEVKSGVILSTQAGDVLRNIVGGVEQLHVMVQQIASATEEMAATSEEINKDIDSIASVSKDTSGNSIQIARASQELANLSVNLESVIGGFRV